MRNVARVLLLFALTFGPHLEAQTTKVAHQIVDCWHSTLAYNNPVYGIQDYDTFDVSARWSTTCAFVDSLPPSSRIDFVEVIPYNQYCGDRDHIRISYHVRLNGEQQEVVNGSFDGGGHCAPNNFYIVGSFLNFNTYHPGASNTIEIFGDGGAFNTLRLFRADLTIFYKEATASNYVWIQNDTDPAASPVEEHLADRTVTANVPLGTIFSVKIIKKEPGGGGISSIVPVVSTYSTVSETVSALRFTDTLFPSNTIVSLHGAAYSGTSLQYAAVHRGRVVLSLLPTSISGAAPTDLTINVVDPTALGTRSNNVDPLVLDYAHNRGIPPHLLKGQMEQESSFNPLTYRYEPLSRWGDFGAITGFPLLPSTPSGTNLRTVNPYARYRLETDTDALNSSLSQGADLLQADIDPRNGFIITVLNSPPAIGTTLRHIEPADSRVLASNIYSNNNAVQHWSRKNPGNAAVVRTRPAVLNFTAQTPTAASYGYLQILYPTAISPMQWHNAVRHPATAAVNPSFLFDTTANMSRGEGSMTLGTGYLVAQYDDVLAVTPSFADRAAFFDSFYEAFNLYNHAHAGCADPRDCYGSEVLQKAKTYRPLTTNPIFP